MTPFETVEMANITKLWYFKWDQSFSLNKRKEQNWNIVLNRSLRFWRNYELLKPFDNGG